MHPLEIELVKLNTEMVAVNFANLVRINNEFCRK
jgi:hypothetical protein